MGKPKGTHFVVSASSTASGAPLYLRADGSWSARLDEAAALADATERDQALAAARRREDLVCDPYAFMIIVSDGRIDPLSKRESIRAQGPTVRIRRPDTGAAVSAAAEV